MSEPDSVSKILNSVAIRPERMADLAKFRRNIVVMFTDIKGSTAYFERFGDTAGLLMVHECNALLMKTVVDYHGRVIKTIGDSVMAVFENSEESVQAAIVMQQQISEQNRPRPEAKRVQIRIGLNYGQGIVKSNDVFGDVVNTASRVETAAGPGQILISDTLHVALQNCPLFRFRRLGQFALKGKAETRDLFEVLWSEQENASRIIAHSQIAADPTVAVSARFKLVQVRSDGSPGTEYMITCRETVIGNNSGDLKFPHDRKMKPRHARLLIESGQCFVESIEDAVVFFRLVAPYRLLDADVVKMGTQIFQFHADFAAVSLAAASGIGVPELNTTLNKPVAELVSLSEAGVQCPMTKELVTLGRTNATYCFPDDPIMSRSHAKIYHRGEDFYLEDAGSRNGTFLKVRGKTPLPEGAALSLGGQLLRLSRITSG